MWQAKELRRVADNMVQLGKEVTITDGFAVIGYLRLDGKEIIALLLAKFLQLLTGDTAGYIGCTAKGCLGYPWR